MPLKPTHRIGPYEIVGALGAGGMGEVYRARDTRLSRDVAVKVLPAEVTHDAGRLERFDREARAIAALNHPHIVTIYSIEEHDGLRFITMEVVDGCTLAELVMPAGMELSRFLDIAIPLADALAAAHHKQITHRDLKPGNVMVSADGRVKVLDFGLARVGGGDTAEQALVETRVPLTQQGTVVGTMPYMSPEQVEGLPLDARSDLFSLGVIFYELLAGQRPFHGSSSPALMSAILRDTPSDLTDRRADVPEALARLVGRLLEKRREDRWQTARDVHNELRHVRRQLDSGISRLAVASLPRELAVAVLPFADLSEKKDQDWFCDGIAEELLNALASLPGLRVAARASSFSFRNTTGDLRVIGDKLNVTTILEGSVRRAGDRVRITARLSDAAMGRQLWSERFDREMQDIFDVQDEIARAIAERLRVTLANDGERLVQKRTANMEAYELLLKGREFVTRRGRAVLEAIPLFQRAIELDPNLSEAHALLGDSYRVLGLFGVLPAGEVMPKAKAATTRALAIDPNQAEALATLAIMATIYDWRIDLAIARSNRALAADRDHVRANVERAISLACIGLPDGSWRDEALHHIGRARALDPLNAWAMALEGAILTRLGDIDGGVAAAGRALDTDSKNFAAHWFFTNALAEAGRDQEAIAAAELALAQSARHPYILTILAAVHARRGERHRVDAIRAELEERSHHAYIGNAARATVAGAAGRWEEARAFLERATAEHDPYVVFWKLFAWRAIWTDRRCAELLLATPLFRNPDGQLMPGAPDLPPAR